MCVCSVISAWYSGFSLVGLVKHRFGNIQTSLDFEIEMSLFKNTIIFFEGEKKGGLVFQAVLTVLAYSEGR